jgi:hypothetical protein
MPKSRIPRRMLVEKNKEVGTTSCEKTCFIAGIILVFERVGCFYGYYSFDYVSQVVILAQNR